MWIDRFIHLLMAMWRYRVVLMIVGIIILLGYGGYFLLASRHHFAGG
jgi:hypothetical protein